MRQRSAYKPNIAYMVYTAWLRSVGAQQGCTAGVHSRGGQCGCTAGMYSGDVQQGCTTGVYSGGVQRGELQSACVHSEGRTGWVDSRGV